MLNTLKQTNKKEPSLVVQAYNPRLEKQGQVDLWSFLARQLSLLGKFQANKRHCPPKPSWVVLNDSQSYFGASTCMET